MLHWKRLYGGIRFFDSQLLESLAFAILHSTFAPWIFLRLFIKRVLLSCIVVLFLFFGFKLFFNSLSIIYLSNQLHAQCKRIRLFTLKGLYLHTILLFAFTFILVLFNSLLAEIFHYLIISHFLSLLPITSIN